MCLSPQVDLIAGVGISVIAVDCIRHLRYGRTAPIAFLPAVFAVHSFTSAFVWFGAQGVVSPAVGDTAADFFMFVAFVLLPMYVPLAILLVEPRGWRRDALMLLTGIGAIAGVEFLIGLVGGRGQAVACNLYIDYTVGGSATFAGGMYVLATVGAMLVSGYRPLFLWGIANAAAVALLTASAQRGLPSFWCAWAATTSLFIAWLLRVFAHGRVTGAAPPWQVPARGIASERSRV